jgi:hypothetical protein
MTNTAPTTRKRIHTRQIVCEGFQRDDGLWDIEGYLLDTRSYPTSTPSRPEIKAGDPLHQMRLRITVDNDMLIHDAFASTENGPHHVCPQINSAYDQLKGMKIGPGFTLRVKERFRGIKGCTHLTELLGPMATTAFQTLWKMREQPEAESANEPAQASGPRKRPPILDGCHALRSDGEVVKVRWPEFYTGEGSPASANAGT